ncbi:MAG: extracellular solute-binding protein [Oscillospiraceae bacterium]|nr:extracellular solute-binding protein [Oscillospiraceae bacterium]
MKQNIKSTIALFLALALVLSMAACGGGNQGTTTEPAPPGGITEDGGTTFLDATGYVFVPEFIDLDLDVQWPDLVAIQGDTLTLYLRYATREEQDLPEHMVESMVTTTSLATIQTDGTGFTTIWTGDAEYLIEETSPGEFRVTSSSDEIIMSTPRPAGGLFSIRQAQSQLSEGENWSFSQVSSLLIFDAAGTVIDEVYLNELLGIDPELGASINNIQAMSDGRVLLGSWEQLHVLTPELDLEQSIPWQDVESFLVAGDDQVLVGMWSEDGLGVWVLDLETGQILRDDDSLFSADLHAAQTGTEFDIYLNAGAAVFGFDLATKEGTRLFDWMDLDMLHGNNFVVAENGDIFFLDPQLQDGQVTLVHLTKQDASTLPDVIEIVYGGLSVDWLIREEIIEFNRRNTGYRIRVREYIDRMSSGDWDTIREAAMFRLNTDIVTGNAPDIIDFGGNLPFEHLARRNLLADLGPLLDRDTEINRGDLVEPMLDLLSIDGTLYTLMPQFSINTLVGQAERVGPDMGWTMDEFLAAVDALPSGATAFDTFVTREQFINRMLTTNLGLFIDRDTGRANFDSPTFMAYLTFAQTLQTDDELFGEGSMPGDFIRPMSFVAEETRIVPPIGELPGDSWESPLATGQVMLSEQNVWGFSDLAFLEGMFGGPVTFIGYPSEYGIGSVVMPGQLIGISAGSDHPDIAWSFIRTLLSEQFQRSNVMEIPMNRTILEERIEAALTAHDAWENPEPDIGGGAEMPTVPPIASEVVTQAQIDQILALIYATDQLAMWDATVVNMIREETLPFFAGDRSIEETVRIIQSRVQTYLSERS